MNQTLAGALRSAPAGLPGEFPLHTGSQAPCGIVGPFTYAVHQAANSSSHSTSRGIAHDWLIEVFYIAKDDMSGIVAESQLDKLGR